MGQDTLTVHAMVDKLNFQLAGLGTGFLPAAWVKPDIAAGRLVEKAVEETSLPESFCIAWRTGERGAALTWWIERLRNSALMDRLALLAISSTDLPAPGAQGQDRAD
jgi:DNA-binding transcriptional LysR family regulator